MASKAKHPSRAGKTAHRPARSIVDTGAEHHEKVPEGAENMEHTLKRLNAEKEKKRQKNPGLYL